MNLVQLNSGHVVAIGFNLHERAADPRIVSWTTPSGFTDPHYNWCRIPYDIAPEFVRLTDTGLIAYQPGRMMEMVFIGGAAEFAFRHYKPDVS